MIPINRYIKNVNFTIDVKKEQNNIKHYQNEDLKKDSFEKKGIFKNKKILTASILSFAVLITAMVKRKQISGLFSTFFKKNMSQINANVKTPPETILENQKTAKKVDSIIEEVKKAQQEKIQYAKDKLIKKVDDGALAGGIGFYGPKSKAKEETFEKFINDLADNEYKIVRIPTIKEATLSEIEKSIYKTIKQAENEFKITGKRTAFVVRDLDILTDRQDEQVNGLSVIGELRETENCKKRGFAWVWDAQDAKNVDSPLRKRTAEIILISPCEQDTPETINQFVDYVNKRNFGQEYKNKLVEYAKKLLENKI